MRLYRFENVLVPQSDHKMCQRDHTIAKRTTQNDDGGLFNDTGGLLNMHNCDKTDTVI